MVHSADPVADRPLELPPVYRLVSVPERAFDHACGLASDGGAGTFVFAERRDVLDFAVVLEPEEPLVLARRAIVAGMNALADAVASFSPPEKPITLSWPATILFDGGRLGGGRLQAPAGCGENETPEWLVFGAMLLAVPEEGMDPGAYPAATWLEEEGFERAEHPALAESFARHLMLAFDTWAEEGFAILERAYLDRLSEPADAAKLEPNGDLRLSGAKRPNRIALAPALQTAAWLDEGTGLPRLTP
jgi:biotin-(acetyl-CoA carboxylase) ligase